jgi:hypothetical protein
MSIRSGSYRFLAEISRMQHAEAENVRQIESFLMSREIFLRGLPRGRIHVMHTVMQAQGLEESLEYAVDVSMHRSPIDRAMLAESVLFSKRDIRFPSLSPSVPSLAFAPRHPPRISANYFSPPRRPRPPEKLGRWPIIARVYFPRILEETRF